MRLSPLLRLMRPALAPTAAADVLAAAAFAGGAPLLPLLGAVGASLCLYTGGMIQNDLFDRERDAKLHPGRPLVVDPGLAGRATLLAVALFLGGLVLAGVSGLFVPGLAVAVLATTYNAHAKRRFPYDSITLGAARAANLWLGIAVAGGGFGTANLTYGIAYFLYIAGVTAGSRAEDMEPKETRRLTLLLAFLPLLVALGGMASLATASRRGLLLVPFVLLLLSLVLAMASGTRKATMRHVLGSLLAIFLLHACVLWGVGKEFAVLPVMACAAASVFLLSSKLTAGS